MRISRHIKRRDSNHQQIVTELEQLGFRVLDLHNVGGCPDLLVSGYQGDRAVNVLVEIKSAGQKLSEGQETFFSDWPGPKLLAYKTEDVLGWFKERSSKQRKG